MIRLLSCLLLPIALLAGCSVATLDVPPQRQKSDNLLTINADYGGRVVDRLVEIELMKLQDTSVAIKGTCVSACTLYLGMDTTCVYPTARLGFHGPSGRTAKGKNVHYKAEKLEEAVTMMVDAYPEWLRDWFKTRGSTVYGKDIIWVPGTSLISVGAKACV